VSRYPPPFSLFSSPFPLFMREGRHCVLDPAGPLHRCLFARASLFFFRAFPAPCRNRCLPFSLSLPLRRPAPGKPRKRLSEGTPFFPQAARGMQRSFSFLGPLLSGSAFLLPYAPVKGCPFVDGVGRQFFPPFSLLSRVNELRPLFLVTEHAHHPPFPPLK